MPRCCVESETVGEIAARPASPRLPQAGLAGDFWPFVPLRGRQGQDAEV